MHIAQTNLARKTTTSTAPTTATTLGHILLFMLVIFQFKGGVSGFEPDFLYPLENVTVAQGRDATFTCVVNNLGGYRVSGDLAATARVCINHCKLNLNAPMPGPQLDYEEIVSNVVNLLVEFCTRALFSTSAQQARQK